MDTAATSPMTSGFVSMQPNLCGTLWLRRIPTEQAIWNLQNHTVSSSTHVQAPVWQYPRPMISDLLLPYMKEQSCVRGSARGSVVIGLIIVQESTTAHEGRRVLMFVASATVGGNHPLVRACVSVISWLAELSLQNKIATLCNLNLRGQPSLI